MLSQVIPPTEQTCVWMSAGLLTYKLCDRDFDCEHCPLDAAMRGRPREIVIRHEAETSRESVTATFPDDRFYSTGHTWLQPLGAGNGRARFGVDCFATSFIARPRRVRRNASRDLLHRGETLCAIGLDLAALSLGIPAAARVGRWNRLLESDPAAVLEAPYGEGWIAELVLAEEGELEDLLLADEAKEQSRLDTKRFRRRLAMQLLAEDQESGAGVEAPPVTDLRQILGGRRYMALVRELIH